jgi:hypothetical protein
MSTEPERYPVEPKITSLVFGFNSLRICPPFWSCEGHLDNQGQVNRLPQVWFYSRSLIYPRIITDLLSKLLAKRVIKNTWHVCVTFSGMSLETAFSIEPDMKVISDPNLKELQADAQAISESLVLGLRQLAISYIKQYSTAG